MGRRSPAEKLAQIHKVLHAWEAFAPKGTFYGFTLTQFKAAVAPSETIRTEIADLQRRLRIATQRRNLADAKSMRLLQNIANGVRADLKHGEDSLLYAAMGYVRRSARRKRRRKTQAKR